MIEPGRQDVWIKPTRDALAERERNLAAQSLGDKDRSEGQFVRPHEPLRPEPARQPKVEHKRDHSFTRGR